MIPITQNYILHELEFIETRRYTINNSSLHKTHGTVNMLNLVDGKSAVIEGDFEPFIVHYAETFIIPASIKEYTIKPYGCDEVKVLKAYVRSSKTSERAFLNAEIKNLRNLRSS